MSDQRFHRPMPGGRRSWQNVHLGAKGATDPTAGRDDLDELVASQVEQLVACWAEKPGWDVIQPAPGFEDELATELARRLPDQANGKHVCRLGPLFVVPDSTPAIAWGQNRWHSVQKVNFDSISEAAKHLRRDGALWQPCPVAEPGRTRLIADSLPRFSPKAVVFGEHVVRPRLGAFTLLHRNTMLYSPHCSSPFPNGLASFVEDHDNPPSRAYLKLWELFTLHKERPVPGEKCLDLGASPGGWTWVLAGLGANVLSVDKAPLEPRVAAMPGVSTLEKSAFSLDPAAMGQFDWLFSDIICEPSRLWTLIERFLQAGTISHYVCSLKFRGETDWDAVTSFESVPGSRVIHLGVNRHELTWICTPPSS